MKELVSIVTPSYNSERFIAEAVSSVLAQTYLNWELIIVDDCSSDSSVDVVRSLAGSDSRVRIIRQDKNSGPAMARNKGIELARGRFIAFLDSDDNWYPEKLERQVGFMLHNGYAFTYSAYNRISESGIFLYKAGVPNKVSYTSLLKTNVIGCLTAMYDVAALGKVFMPTSNRREDYATWLEVLKRVDYAYGMQDVLANYRIYDGQSSAKKLEMARECWKLYREVERISFLKSVYFFSNYAARGVLGRWLPLFLK